MAYTILTATEAAAMIKNNENIALSGFTPAGVAKAVTKELAKIAVAEHEAGREFKVGIFTGASTGQSTDGDLANAHAIKYRAPYTTNPDFRKHVNLGEIPYNDLHLSHMAQELRYGFYGQVDWAILEVCDIEEVGDDYHVYLTAAGGISPTAARLAKKVILELNSFHSPDAKYIHDVYEPLDPPYRKPIPIFNVSDRIGVPYVSIPKSKVVGVVECNIPDEARAFTDSDPVTFGQFAEMLITFHFDVEFLAGIHGKTIDDDLTELAMIHVGFPRCFQRGIVETLTEIAVDNTTSWTTDQTNRNDKNGRKDIQQTHVTQTENPYERSVHP